MVLGILSFSQFSGSESAYKEYLQVCRDVLGQGIRAVGSWPCDWDLLAVDERGRSAGDLLRRLSGANEWLDGDRSFESSVADSQAIVRVAPFAGRAGSVPRTADDDGSCSGRNLERGVGDCSVGLDNSSQKASVDSSSASDVVGVTVPGVGVRGKNYEKNREKKRRRKELRACGRGVGSGLSQGEAVNQVWRSVRVEKEKNRLAGGSQLGVEFGKRRSTRVQGHFSDLPEDSQKSLKGSYAARLQAENELKLFRARQQLELEKAKDFTQLKKRQETQIMRQTELNKVQVEKAFAQLARTGNVPGVVGSVKTVVSESSSSSPLFSGVGSGTISPNSSASAAEVYAVHREILEKTHENEKLRARLDKLKVVNPVVYTELGFDKELPPTVGTGVTVDAHGDPIIGGFEEGGSDVFGYDGYVGDDGRFHFGENPAIYDA